MGFGERSISVWEVVNCGSAGIFAGWEAGVAMWERGYLCRLEAGATLWELGPFGT